MRVQIPTRDFAFVVADEWLAARAEDRAAEMARGLQAPGLADEDRVYLEGERDRLTDNARKLRDSAERRRNPNGGEVVQLDQRARARAEAGR